MPSTRKEQPSPATASSQDTFVFPPDQHLLITTPSQIYAWDTAGIHTVFTSSKSGIVAAREAKDGSGVLAVAGKRVVVLHDTKRGQEKSWGLEANDDEVRHLEYTADAKSLFLSTNLTADIQRYSAERSKLLSPARSHASPPVALAVSPSGGLMVSASDRPPIVYLKNLSHNSAPVPIECTASEAAVSVTAFHPERPNIFLLAFRDGTLAAYDATRIGRAKKDSYSNQERVNKGEIARLANVHRTTFHATRAPCIADAAFLPGYKTRAVSVGRDGRCRLIDFADGGAILRTWHAKAPVTSLSVLSLKAGPHARNDSVGSRSSHTIGGPTSTNNLLAIGRTDGVVHVYDSLGLLLSQQTMSRGIENIIRVEWAKGMSPRPIAESVLANDEKPLPSVETKSTTPNDGTADVTSPISGPSMPKRRATNFEHVGLPAALRRPKEPVNEAPSVGPVRRFTVHPDEVEDGTVRHTPMLQQVGGTPVAKANYLDLFSPVKPVEQGPQVTLERRVASPPRSRPRLSSQTFIKSPEPDNAVQPTSIAEPRNLGLFPSTDSGSEPAHTLETKTKSPKSKPSKQNTSTTVHQRHISFKPSPRRRSRKSSTFGGTAVGPNNNAKLLADLRQLSTVHPAHRPGGVLSSFSTAKPDRSQKPTTSLKRSALRIFHRPADDHIETDLNSEKALKAYEHVHKGHKWPEDSVQDTSLDGDIWLTSDSDETLHSRKHRPRPPARQTSRPRVTSKGTVSTIEEAPAPLAVKVAAVKATVDDGYGSTDEGMQTADTHISPTATFSPSSKEVRELFPRSSSLSPRKGKGKGKRKSPKHSAVNQSRGLVEDMPGSPLRRQTNSPWDRVKASKNAASVGQPSTQQAIVTDARPYRHTPEAPGHALVGRQAGPRPVESSPQPYRHAPEAPNHLLAGKQATPRPVESNSQPYQHAPEAPRHSVAGREAGTRPIETDARPYHHAPEAPNRLLVTTEPGSRPIEKEPRPYHHAPEAPLSMHTNRLAVSEPSDPESQHPNTPPDDPHCRICSPTKERVQSLESEVARLKGEVLSLKAAFRRSGVALPTKLR